MRSRWSCWNRSVSQLSLVGPLRTRHTPRMTDLHDRIYDELTSQITTLEGGALLHHPDGSAWSTTEVEQSLSALHADRELLKEHWRITPGAAGLASENPPQTASCGNPQPCPHVLGLAAKYSVPVTG